MLCLDYLVQNFLKLQIQRIRSATIQNPSIKISLQDNYNIYRTERMSTCRYLSFYIYTQTYTHMILNIFFFFSVYCDTINQQAESLIWQYSEELYNSTSGLCMLLMTSKYYFKIFKTHKVQIIKKYIYFCYTLK